MSALLVVAVIVFILLLLRYHEKSTNALCTSQKKLDGKVAIVTGGTSGIGLEIAKDFARRGAKVIIACPFKGEGLNAKKEIIEETKNNDVVFKLLDLCSIDSVRNFVAEIYKEEDRLDILINNAGVGVPADFVTPDGMSFIMQVNYFGHFLLTILLLPLMKKTGTFWQPSRIINTSSVLHMFGAYDIKNLNRSNHLFMVQIYAKSKLAMILFARELTRRLKGSGCHVVINSVDPGAVGTEIFNSLSTLVGPMFTFLFGNVFKTPWEGAQTTLHVALDPEAGEVSGEFFKNCKQTKAVTWAYNDRLASYVWKRSVRYVKLSDDELTQCLEIDLISSTSI